MPSSGAKAANQAGTAAVPSTTGSQEMPGTVNTSVSALGAWSSRPGEGELRRSLLGDGDPPLVLVGRHVEQGEGHRPLVAALDQVGLFSCSSVVSTGRAGIWVTGAWVTGAWVTGDTVTGACLMGAAVTGAVAVGAAAGEAVAALGRPPREPTRMSPPGRTRC